MNEKNFYAFKKMNLVSKEICMIKGEERLNLTFKNGHKLITVRGLDKADNKKYPVEKQCRITVSKVDPTQRAETLTVYTVNSISFDTTTGDEKLVNIKLRSNAKNNNWIEIEFIIPYSELTLELLQEVYVIISDESTAHDWKDNVLQSTFWKSVDENHFYEKLEKLGVAQPGESILTTYEEMTNALSLATRANVDYSGLVPLQITQNVYVLLGYSESIETEIFHEPVLTICAQRGYEYRSRYEEDSLSDGCELLFLTQVFNVSAEGITRVINFIIDAVKPFVIALDTLDEKLQ